MADKREEVLRSLREALDDRVLSRSEKRAVKALLEEYDISNSDRAWLRSHIFDMAHEISNADNYYQVITWLEEVNKVLLPDTEQKESFNSVYFSPGVDCLNAIIYQIQRATKSLQICVFTITDDRISNEIKAAEERGVNIKVISDGHKAHDLGSDIFHLAGNGINIREDNTPEHMHHKFAIVDGDTLINGSYNWTRSAADKNEENILITNEPELVRPYIQEFDKLWDKMTAVTP